MHLTIQYELSLRAVTHRRCVHALHGPVHTAVACSYAASLCTCTSRLGTHSRCMRLRTIVAYIHLTIRYASPLRAVTNHRCVHAPHDPVRTAIADRSANAPTTDIQHLYIYIYPIYYIYIYILSIIYIYIYIYIIDRIDVEVNFLDLKRCQLGCQIQIHFSHIEKIMFLKNSLWNIFIKNYHYSIINTIIILRLKLL